MFQVSLNIVCQTALKMPLMMLLMMLTLHQSLPHKEVRVTKKKLIRNRCIAIILNEFELLMINTGC